MGLIPAHAASTAPQVRELSTARAHPRSRGEHFTGELRSTSPLGSSPLTRGARAVQLHLARGDGLIPAHAGSTEEDFQPHQARPAHPRSRGEHLSDKEITDYIAGSSPLTRGAPPHHDEGTRHAGLIPAHAGSTRNFSSSTCSVTAHPRSRGEHITEVAESSMLPGSSPLTRGAHLVAALLEQRAGLIPAHAGSTRRPARRSARQRAHPRSRGEHPRPVGVAQR